jgi:FixJ family two-component response regulator
MPTSEPAIAVVDDDESVRRALRRFIDLLGFQVETFPTAEEFLESCRLPPSPRGDAVAEPFRCLILDVHLPGMSGLELQERLKAQGQDVAIIFITAYPNERARNQALEAGAVAFLHKPFDEQAFVDAINEGVYRDQKSSASRVPKI